MSLGAIVRGGLRWLLEGRPSVVVRDGELQRRALRRERMNPKDLMAHLRTLGVGDLRQVKLAVVEYNGKLSVLHQDWAESAQRADTSDRHARARHEATDGRGPAPDQRTDAPALLESE